MILTEHTAEGLVLRVRPEGVARFGGALFLSVWLCFWALGEATVLGVLGAGAWALLQGRPQLASLPSLGVGAFLLVWVTFWTFGGIVAMGELLRIVSSEDVLTVGPQALTVRRRRGPFSWTRTFPREGVRNVRVVPRGRMLVFDTARRSIHFAPVPTPADERAAVLALRKELSLEASHEGEAVLPEGWEESITPEGDRVLLRDPKARRKQALVLGGIAVVAWMLALALAWNAMSQKPTLSAAIALTVIAALAACGAYWLEAGRQELKLSGERVIVRRRWRGKLRELHPVDRLELVLDTDSDGDVWYRLEGVRGGPIDPRARRRKPRRTIVSAMNDPFEPSALGRWLAARTGLPYTESD